MPEVNLKNIISQGKSAVASAQGKLEQFAGAAGTGGFSVSAGPNGVSLQANFNEVIKRSAQARNTVKSPLKRLYDRSDVFKGTILFPLDLDDEHYMIYKRIKRTRPSRTSEGTKEVLQNIVLPIPTNLNVGYAAQYSNENLGAIGAATSGMMTSSEVGDTVSDLGSLVKDKMAATMSAIKNQDTDAAVKMAGLATAAGIAGAGAAVGGPVLGALVGGDPVTGAFTGAMLGEGVAVNPHLAAVFKGVGFRNFSFQYNFIARNALESRMIRNIIKEFKYAMHPDYALGKLGFTYPDEFEIEFSEKLGPYLFRIQTSVLNSLNVTYNGESTPLFYEQTGAPVSIGIQLGFQETRILTKSNMDDFDFAPLTDTEGSF